MSTPIAISSDTESPQTDANNINDNSTAKIEENHNLQTINTDNEITTMKEIGTNGVSTTNDVKHIESTVGKLTDEEDTTKNVDLDAKNNSDDKQQQSIEVKEKEDDADIDKNNEQYHKPHQDQVIEAKSGEQTDKDTQEEIVSKIQQTEEDEKNKVETVEADKPIAEKQGLPKWMVQSANEEDQKNEANIVGSDKPINEKHGLPKWMVQSANAPPSPSPEAIDKIEQKQETPSSGALTKGRRGRRPATEVVKAATIVQTTNELSSLRPRRSTRSRVDYANPDPLTVLAEADDEEPYGKRRGIKGQTSTGRGTARGRKRKIVTTSDDADIEHDDDGDEEYSARKKSKKRTSNTKKTSDALESLTTPKAKRGRGRPAGTGSKNRAAITKTTNMNMGKYSGGRRKRKPIESDDEQEEEVVYDDHDSEKEITDEESMDEIHQKIPIAPRKNKVNNTTTSSSPNKQLPKKRGRPPAAARQEQKKNHTLLNIADEDDDNKNAKSPMDKAELHEHSLSEKKNDDVSEPV